jgi:MFS family permease
MKSTLRPLFSILLGLLFLIVGHGMQLTLIPLRAGALDWSKFEIGAVGSSYYVGYVFGCFVSPYLIRRAGHIRAFTVLTATVTTAMLAHALWVAFVPWLLFRLFLGGSLAGLYMILESWVNDRASNANRGFVMSSYIMVNYVALAIGQFMVTLAAPTEFTLFAVSAMAMSISAIPLALTSQAQPAPVAVVKFRPLRLYKSSPVGLVGASVAGIATGAFWSLGAVAAVGVGLSARVAAIFMGIFTTTGAVAQWPIGRISDHIDRRIVLIAILIAAAAVGVLLAALPHAEWLWFVLAGFLGAAMAPTYSVAAAHAYDHAEPGTMVETAEGLFVASASGSIVGPLVASALMDHFGAQTLFLFNAGVHVALAIYVLARVRTRPPIAQALKTEFDFAASSPVSGGAPVEPEFLPAEHASPVAGSKPADSQTPAAA